jgi:hypothetical protein
MPRAALSAERERQYDHIKSGLLEATRPSTVSTLIFSALNWLSLASSALTEEVMTASSSPPCRPPH